MEINEKKGITVKVDADLHAEVKQFLEAKNITMAEFVTLAIQDELHPKYQEKEENTMAKMRTLAFQVPEDLFRKIKEYLHRNNMTQKDFVIGLIESELERDLIAREEQNKASETKETEDEEIFENQDNVCENDGVEDESYEDIDDTGNEELYELDEEELEDNIESDEEEAADKFVDEDFECTDEDEEIENEDEVEEFDEDEEETDGLSMIGI